MLYCCSMTIARWAAFAVHCKLISRLSKQPGDDRCRESDDRILGLTMTGDEAGEVLAAVQRAMLADLPFDAARSTLNFSG